MKNLSEFKIQMVTSTKSSEKYPDLVPGSCTVVAHWFSQEDMTNAENNFYLNARYSIIINYTISFHSVMPM